MAGAPSVDLRGLVLSIIEAYRTQPNSLQSGSVLREAKQRLGLTNREQEQALLMVWNDLFRTGYLGWGTNIDNSEPPFFHVTPRGSLALAYLSRD